MSSQTVDETRRKRVQHARKRGLTVREIAVREGVSTRTVERILSGRRFQQTLLELRPRLAVQRLMRTNRLDRIIERELRVLETAVNHKSRYAPCLGIKELVGLGHLSALLQRQAEALLAPLLVERER